MAQTDARLGGGLGRRGQPRLAGPGPGPGSSLGVGVGQVFRHRPFRAVPAPHPQHAQEGRGTEQRLRRHEQVKFGVQEVEQERDERRDEGAHDQDQAERDPGRLGAVGLVGGDQEQGVDQQVAEADAVVVDAEPHAEQRVKRVREVPGDELVGQRQHGSEQDVVDRQAQREPCHVVQLHPALHVQVGHRDRAQADQYGQFGPPQLPAGRGPHQVMAGPVVEPDQQPDAQPGPAPAEHRSEADGQRRRERDDQQAGDQPVRQVPVQERQGRDEREQDHDVAAVEGADRRPFQAHLPEVQQGAAGHQRHPDQDHAELGEGLLEEGDRLRGNRHVTLPRVRAGWRKWSRAGRSGSGAARWPGRRRRWPGPRPGPRRRGGGGRRPRRSRRWRRRAG